MRDLLLLFFHFHFRLLSEWQSILAAEKCLRCTWHGFTIHTVSARPRRQSNVCSYLHTWLFSFFLFTLNSIVWLCELECLCVCVCLGFSLIVRFDYYYYCLLLLLWFFSVYLFVLIAIDDCMPFGRKCWRRFELMLKYTQHTPLICTVYTWYIAYCAYLY